MRTLRNAVERGKVHHAYLFVGSRGTGKTSMAKILAACLNCEHGPTIEPCGECDSCVSIARATSLDVIEMDAASNNSVDDIRELRESVAYAPGQRAPQGLHPRRGPHALDGGLERVPEDARGAPAEHRVRARHDRGGEGAGDRRRPLPPLRLPPPHRRADRHRRAARGRGGVDRDPARGGRRARALGHRQLPRRARHARAAGHLQRHRRSRSRTCWRCSASPTRVCSRRPSTRSPPATPRRALRALEQCAEQGRDAGSFARDLEARARELLLVQTLGEVPAELSLTPEADEALRAQAQRIGHATVVRAARAARRGDGGRARGRRPAHAARARARQGRPARGRRLDAGPARAHRAPRAARRPPAAPGARAGPASAARRRARGARAAAARRSRAPHRECERRRPRRQRAAPR